MTEKPHKFEGFEIRVASSLPEDVIIFMGKTSVHAAAKSTTEPTADARLEPLHFVEGGPIGTPESGITSFLAWSEDATVWETVKRMVAAGRVVIVTGSDTSK